MKKYLFMGGVILVAGFLINYTLGGFATIEPEIIETDNYIIYGTDFEGSYKSSKLSNLVNEMRSHQQQLETSSDLVIVNYINEAKETIGDITNFVGLRINTKPNSTVLGAFEKRIIKASRAVRISVKIKPLVMPSPEKIKSVAIEYATSQGIQLQDLTIEQYKENGVLVVEFPIKNKTEEKETNFIERVGNSYGIEHFDTSKTWHYTFNVKKGEVEVSRAWTWHPSSGEVTLIEKGDTIMFNHNSVSEDLKKADHKFINDKYWLLFPFQLVWDSGYTFELTKNITSPLSKISITKLTVTYNKIDGYTPGDAYDLYVDKKMEIKEWSFRKGGQDEPTLTTTWEDYKSYNGIKLSTDHYSEDSLFRLWFTDVKIED